MLIPTPVAPLITNAILLHCGYKSIKAIESEAAGDDKKWLTFWFVHTLFSFIKSMLDYVAFVIPMYTDASIAVIVYLGFFGGAQVIYSNLLQPLLLKHEKEIDTKIDAALKTAQNKWNEVGKKKS